MNISTAPKFLQWGRCQELKGLIIPERFESAIGRKVGQGKYARVGLVSGIATRMGFKSPPATTPLQSSWA